MTIVKRIALGSVLLLSAMLVAAFLLLKFTDFNRYKPLIQAQVKNSLGRTLSIKGDIQLDFGFNSQLVANNIELSNVPWGSQQTMISIKRAEAEIALLPLLFGNVHIDRLILSEPNILLETNASGKGNWLFHKLGDNDTTDDSEDKQQDPTLLRIGHVLFSKVTINYRDGASGEETRFSLKSIEANTHGSDDGVDLQMVGSINKQRINISAQLASLSKLLEEQASSLTMEVAYGNRKNAQFNAQLTGQLAMTPAGYTIEELQLTLNDNQLTGRVHYGLSRNRPTLNADLYFETLDLKRFTGGKSGAVSKRAPKKDKLFSANKIDFSSLKAIDANIAIKGEKILGSKLAFNNLSLKAKLADGVLKISPFSLGIEGSTLRNTLVLDTRKKLPRLTLSSKGKKISLGKILRKTDTTDLLVNAPATVDISLTGNGDSAAAIAGSLSGRIFVDVGRGRVNNQYLNLIGADLTAKLVETFDSSKKNKAAYTQLECAVINLRPRNGIIKYDNKIAMETDEMVIVSSGIIDLKKETLSVGIVPKPRKGGKGLGLGAGGLVSITHLHGSLAKPEFGLEDDMGTAVKFFKVFGALATGGSSLLLEGLIKKVTDDPHPCQTAKGIKKPRKKGIKETIMGKFRDFKNKF